MSTPPETVGASSGTGMMCTTGCPTTFGLAAMVGIPHVPFRDAPTGAEASVTDK